MKQIFSRCGIPEIVIADNMPFGSFEMKLFLVKWNFKIETSSPVYPKSNGLAEKTVGIVKSMLRKSKETGQDIELFLLNYRNSPVANLLFSPSQMLNSRIMRSKLPISFKNLIPNLVPKNVYEEMTKNLAVQKQYYDVNAREIVDFEEGERVFIGSRH